MLKKFIFNFILVISTYGNTYAQEFASNDSKWVYNHRGFWSYGISQVQFDRDTFINGRLTKIFKKELTLQSRMGGSASTWQMNPVYLQSDNGVVLYSEDAIQFDTLYNFIAKIGTEWSIVNRNIGSRDTLLISILDTFETMISGQKVSGQIARYKFNNFGNRIDTVLKNVGALQHYILPFDELEVAVDGGEGGILRCFYNDIFGAKAFNTGNPEIGYEYDCSKITNVNSEKFVTRNEDFDLSIRDETLFIDNKRTKLAFVDLFDGTGKSLHQQKLASGLNQIDLKKLPFGILFVLIDHSYLSKVFKI
ncbi:MAG: hypothetical protein IPM92_04235 [Saprospiraceae bacterium]|nr:hypothetical protein [Saprospiraceae bacterium]